MPTATPARRGASLARVPPSPSETPRRHPTASDAPSLGVVGSALSPTSRARRARSSASPHPADPERRHARRSPPPLAPTDDRDDDQADVGDPSEALGIRGYAARRTLATRASPTRPAPEDADTLEEPPPTSVFRVAARADVHPLDDEPEPPAFVEPALGLLDASSNANAVAGDRTDDGSVRTLGTLSTRGSHPSSPDAAARRARRLEDDFERVRERYRDRLAAVEAAIVAARAEGDAFEAAGRFGNGFAERETFPDPSRAFDASDADAAADSDSDSDSDSDPTRAWSPEDSEGDAALEAAYAEAFGAAAAHAAAAAASARAAERAMAASREGTPPTTLGDGLGPDPGLGLDSSRFGDADAALRELEARMEANDRGAGGDAEEYDEFAAARIEREYLLDASDDEYDPFATGGFGFGAGDRGAGEGLDDDDDDDDDDDGDRRADASLARVRERARADLVARSRAREAEREESERFLRRLARIGVPPGSTRPLNLVGALGFQTDAELERARASRRAGEDHGEFMFARFAREDAAVAAGGWRKRAGGDGDWRGAARDVFGGAARASSDGDDGDGDVLGEGLGAGRTRAVSCVAFARARATTDARDAARDAAFVASVLAGLPGVDPGDDRVACAVAAVAR